MKTLVNPLLYISGIQRVLFTIRACVLLCLAGLVSRGQRDIAFRQLTLENGLSQGSVISIAQDSYGFIWLGTMDGLNRFDGNRVKIYKTFYAENPAGSNNKINQLISDPLGRLWIGTDYGLYIYNEQIDSFQAIFHETQASLADNEIKCIYRDHESNIWLGTARGLTMWIYSTKGLLQFRQVPRKMYSNNSDSSPVQAIIEDSRKQIWIGTHHGLSLLGNRCPPRYRRIFQILSGQDITTLAEDSSRQLWIGTYSSGVYTLNLQTGVSKHYKSGSGDPDVIASNSIRKILVDRTGLVWIGTLKGLSIFNPKGRVFENHVHKPELPHSLNYNSVYSLFEDTQGNIWVGTFFGGVNIKEAITTPFMVYKNRENNNSLSGNVISSMAEDLTGHLWIGLEGEGLNCFNETSHQFSHYRFRENHKTSLRSNLIKSLLMDRESTLWVGLHNGILERKLKNQKGFEHFRVGKPSHLNRSQDIRAIMEDSKGQLWVGKSGSGIYISNAQKKQFKPFRQLFPHLKLENEFVTCLFLDHKKDMWIGTKGGLHLWRESDQKLLNIRNTQKKGKPISENIHCIQEDQMGLIWFGTNSGLSCYDNKTGNLQTFNRDNGLPADKVVGILIDKENNLWLSSNRGIIKMDRVSHECFSYDQSDGLPALVYNANSCYRDFKGHLFFGSFEGLVEFDPGKIGINHQMPKVSLTDIFINGKSIFPRDSSGILECNFCASRKIKLDYTQNRITIQYAVFNYIKPEKNRSAYLLEGFDKNWIATAGHMASFSNLRPGTYHLFIKAANNDGLWNRSAPFLTIVITPPVWKSWWAYPIYLILFLTGMVGVFYFLYSRRELKRKLAYEHALNLQQQELHKMKIDFFTHISHEIRTPLTLIAGPAEMLLGQDVPAPISQKLLQSIKSNAERLLKLTNDLLDFRTADAGHTVLKIQCDNLVSVCKTVFERFAGEALHRKIQYSFTANQQEVMVYFDSEHMEVVVSNLLSNALKFAAMGGNVGIEVYADREQAFIEVHDDGPGIPPGDSLKIFNEFYQVNRAGDNKKGAGIGLSFSRRLVELHKGKISCSSRVRENGRTRKTVFTVALKLGKTHFE